MSIPERSSRDREYQILFEVPNSVTSYVATGQSLLISFINRAVATFKITGRILTKNFAGESSVIVFQRSITPNQFGTPDDYAIPMSDGYLISLVVEVQSGQVVQGDTYISGAILNALDTTSDILQVLIGAYISTNVPISYPQTQVVPPLSGQGAIRTMNIGPNAPGTVNVSAQFVQYSVQRFINAALTFTTDANAAVRYLYAQFTVDAGMATPLLLNSSISAGIPASQVIEVQISNGLPFDYVRSGGIRRIGLQLPECWGKTTVPPAFTTAQFAVYCINVQAGDQFNSGTISFQEWLNA